MAEIIKTEEEIVLKIISETKRIDEIQSNIDELHKQLLDFRTKHCIEHNKKYVGKYYKHNYTFNGKIITVYFHVIDILEDSRLVSYNMEYDKSGSLHVEIDDHCLIDNNDTEIMEDEFIQKYNEFLEK